MLDVAYYVLPLLLVLVRFLKYIRSQAARSLITQV